jgi:hypothetical protein
MEEKMATSRGDRGGGHMACGNGQQFEQQVARYIKQLEYKFEQQARVGWKCTGGPRRVDFVITTPRGTIDLEVKSMNTAGRTGSAVEKIAALNEHIKVSGRRTVVVFSKGGVWQRWDAWMLAQVGKTPYLIDVIIEGDDLFAQLRAVLAKV